MEDRISHILTVKDSASFIVDDLSLFIHYLVIFKQVLTNTKVIALNLLLSFLNRTGKHLMLDLFAVFHTKCIKDIHQSL